MKAALIGSPVYHSKSPDVYAKIFTENGIDGSFTVMELPSLDNIRKKMQEFDAFAVTMPYKQAIIPYLDCLSDEAAFLQSVNFVTIKNGTFCGYSTDGEGFCRAFLNISREIIGKSFLIHGTGGAAASVAYSLKKYGARVAVCGRNSKHVLQFAEKLGVSADMLCNAYRYDVFINATPLGMYGFADYSDFSFLYGAKPDFFVCDLVYNPKETELIKEVQRQGYTVQNGYTMLQMQAAAAFGIWHRIICIKSTQNR